MMARGDTAATRWRSAAELRAINVHWMGEEKTRRMRVLIITLGTRGDVEPFIALGLELKARGHGVTICTGSGFADVIRGHSLDYAYWVMG